VSPLRIGIDLGGTKIEGMALDGRQALARVRVETPRGDYDGTVAAIVSLVADLERRAGATGTVGVGIPGTLSPVSGLVKNSNSICLIGTPFKADLEIRLGRGVRVANDANCFTVSEATDGAAEGAYVVFGVIVGTGTGGGITVGGQVLEGPNGLAGEWGHNPLPWADGAERPGPDCYCGKRGCIERFLSGPGMTADYEGVTGRVVDPRQIVNAAVGGDVVAEAALARYEARMARALAGVINVFDPDVIVLGGGMSNIARLYDNVPALWTDHVFGAVGRVPGSARDPLRTRLVRAKHGDASGVRGAAWLWP
jgi:fructokinase